MRTLSLPPAEVWILPQAAALSTAAADEIARVAREAVTRDGRCSLALAGGSTPRATYAELATGEKSGSRPLSWGTIHLFLSDERLVPLTHPDSNYRMVREALLDPIAIPSDPIHPVATELKPPAAASHYEETIRKSLGADTGTPRFDLILLGLGADGHTASLFPGTEALREDQALVTSNWVPRLQAQRITFTFPLINHARQVMFLVTGADKAQVVQEVLQPKTGRSQHPAAHVRPRPGRLLWLLDESAAVMLGQ